MKNYLARRDFLSMMAATGAYTALGGGLTGCLETDLAQNNLRFDPNSTVPALGGSPDRPWWLRGNYAPVPDEIEAFDLEVKGNLPPELNGYFLRNGPNPREDSPFWLLADGMMHAVELRNGKAISYRNRWIQTTVWEEGDSGMLSNFANTSYVYHGDKLLALYEMGAPYQVDVENLNTQGIHRFDGSLLGPMGAHPKQDPLTGELYFIGYFPVPPYLRFHHVSAAGELLKTTELSLPRAVMMHDFQLTERFAIFFDMPLIFELENAENTFMPIRFAPEHGARIGVMPRDGSDADLEWYEVDPCLIFHSFNAYEDASGKVVVEGCRIPSMWENGIDPKGPLGMGEPWAWTLDTVGKTVSEGPLNDLRIDFPTIDTRRQGRAHKYNYGLRLQNRLPDHPMFPDGVVKHDRLSGNIDAWDCGFAVQPDEALFVPSAGAQGEDEGYLLTMVYHRAENCSELVVLDATALSKGPIARVKMPRRVPFGFHGLWVPRLG